MNNCVCPFGSVRTVCWSQTFSRRVLAMVADGTTTVGIRDQGSGIRDQGSGIRDLGTEPSGSAFAIASMARCDLSRVESIDVAAIA
jgi:hypothetical protein